MNQENPFKALRESKNPNEMEDYKAKDLAKDLGISTSRISDLETGERKPTLSQLKKYHDYFKVPYEYLLGENPSQYYEYMVASKELGLSGKAIKIIKELTKNKTYARLLNILIEKHISNLLVEISNGTTYMDIINEIYENGNNKNKSAEYRESLENANNEAMEALQEITNKTGHILRLISGNQNIDYCKMKAGAIMQEAVEKILYNWGNEE